MEWTIILWLLIINGGLGGQYILNHMAKNEKFVGAGQTLSVSPGVMTWWREISKLLWALIAVSIELFRGMDKKFLWPGVASMVTITICAFTGVTENIGFFYLSKYSPHLFAPYVNVYLALLPFFGYFLFKTPVRKEHWIGITLVIIGLMIGSMFELGETKKSVYSSLDTTAIIWIVIINCCLCSQQVLNNKTVQLANTGVRPNALVVWREIWKMLFITAALIIFPIISELTGVTNEFYELFTGTIIPNNWWPILFVVLAGLTGYIYSFGFFNLSKFAAHLWVPYTNAWLAIIPFIMFLPPFSHDVTIPQIIGAIIVTAGLMVGVSDYNKHKIVEIEKKGK